MAPRSPAGDAFSRLCVQIFRLNGLLLAAGDRLAAPAGQTSARWQVLAVLDHGPATVAAVARLMGLARQSVQRTAHLLVKEGLCRFTDNPSDRRASLLRMRPRGRKALRTIERAQRVWADAAGAQIGAPALKRASTVLEWVLDSLAFGSHRGR